MVDSGSLIQSPDRHMWMQHLQNQFESVARTALETPGTQNLGIYPQTVARRLNAAMRTPFSGNMLNLN